MGETNISAVMLTLNEADKIERTLDSAGAIFDELVLVDGNSDDGTVDVAEQWCEEHGKNFDVVHSTEREYLLEGPGSQRRRGEELITNDYSLALGADVEVEVLDEDWFEREFQFNAYSHTRTKISGQTLCDYRLYRPFPDMDKFQFDDKGEVPRWRSYIHEEIQDSQGEHVSDIYHTADAPMIHHQKRQGAMDTVTTYGKYPHRHHPEFDGNVGPSLKKQHYLLKKSLSSDSQSLIVQQNYRDYYRENEKLIATHWKEIVEEYDLPKEAWDNVDEVEDNNIELATNMGSGDSFTTFDSIGTIGYIKEYLGV